MSSIFYILFTAVLVISALAYFRLARIFKIVDVPNHRTMHDGATIRGGGIIILIALLLLAVFQISPGNYFLLGAVILGITGFLDDLIDLPTSIRFLIQATSVFLIFLELDLLQLHPIFLLAAIVVAAGTLNAFNFMDGINGITVGYALIACFTFLYLNNFYASFISNDFIYLYIIALLVFGFFNFRKEAVCFAGDVGSFTIAYINVFLVIKLIAVTGQLSFILLFLLYGIDTVFTIIQRIYNRENIFEAHRSHLFQVGIQHTKMTHLQMSVLYMLVQGLVNTILILSLGLPFYAQLLICLMIMALSALFYIFLKVRVLRLAR